MPNFTDNEQRVWTVTVNCYQLKRVRERLGLSLADMTYGDLNDPVNLVNVLYVLVEKSAKEREVTEESFGESLFGDVITDATTALLEALADFFPQPTRGRLLKTVAEMKREKAKPTRRSEAATASGT